MLKKYIFSLLLCLSFCISVSQTFVDDVERVSIVVIDYCVDEKGERHNIKINNEKTTYLNEAWQQGCMNHFKNGTLRYPMKMVNECWQAVYYFVNTKYKTYELPQPERVKCNAFLLGEYKYESPAYSETKIIRRKRKQIEKGGLKGDRQVYKIKWLDDHIYELTAIKMPLEKDKHKEGNIVKVEIIELLNENTYLYKAIYTHIEDSNYVYGLITKVK